MYVYTLYGSDLKKLGITNSEAKEYSIEQSSYSGKFSNMYEWYHNPYIAANGNRVLNGIIRGDVVIKGEQLNDEQINYIIKNCKCEEY